MTNKIIKIKMALIKTIDLTIFEKKSYEVKDVNENIHEGYSYKGFDDTNSIHSFTSKRDNVKVYDVSGYDDTKLQNFVLDGKCWEGKTKWQLK